MKIQFFPPPGAVVFSPKSIVGLVSMFLRCLEYRLLSLSHCVRVSDDFIEVSHFFLFSTVSSTQGSTVRKLTWYKTTSARPPHPCFYTFYLIIFPVFFILWDFVLRDLSLMLIHISIIKAPSLYKPPIVFLPPSHLLLGQLLLNLILHYKAQFRQAKNTCPARNTLWT